MNKCRNCDGKLEILGTGYYGDNIRVACKECNIEYEVEPDGLGMAGYEWVIAKEKDMLNCDKEEI